MKISARHAGAAALLLFTTPAFPQQRQPVAPVREVVDTYFGTRVTDPYRWMEEKSPELDTWMKAQNDYTRAYLDRLPMRSQLLSRFMEISGSSTSAGNFQRAGDNYFSLRRGKGDNEASLYVRHGLTGKDELLVDVNKLTSDGKRSSIATYSVSPDGHYISYLVSPGGGEYGSLRIFDMATRKSSKDEVVETRWGAGTWMPDSKSFSYMAFQKLAPGAPPSDRLKNTRQLLHTVGTSESTDRPLFGFAVDPAIVSPSTMLPFLDIQPGSKFAFVYQNSGVEPNSEVFIAPVDKLAEQRIPWRKVASFDDDVTSMWAHGEDLFVQTFKNASGSKIISTSVSNPDFAHATTVFESKTDIVNTAGAARDAFYVETLANGVGSIRRISYKTGKAELVRLPYEGSAGLEGVDPRIDGALVNLISWTKPSQVLSYNPAHKTAVATTLRPNDPTDLSSIVHTSVMVTSWDGTKVPMTILHKRGMKLDGKNPTVIEGYGAYGSDNMAPTFASFVLPWMERGGVYAFIGVRGGGSFGEEWHLAGKGKNKPNTWKDFIAGAEWLVKNKYTSPSHLAGRGTSAGGVLIGNAIVERPDLFRAAYINVGITNALRYETTPNGPANIPEFGSVTTEQGFKDLLAMDAYSKVKKGVNYPAVILLTGANDPRVEPWISAKMAARLQAATSSGRPVLLSIDYDAGHGSGLTREQTAKRNADLYAFLFDQLK